ncbi:MAG: MBOAT family protein [Firmicutes bacterium]|nr:MBOAT family protein [Bacillota bacterium]
MVFSSIPFLFYFLVLFLALYYVVPFKLKNYVLLVFSLLFYAWGEPIYVFLMMFSAGVDWLDGLMLEKHPKAKKLYLTIAIVINLGLLCFFKYANFLMGAVGSIFKIAVPAVNVTLPIGISFYTFQSMSYSLDVYRGDAKVEHNYFYYLMYVSMFPQLIAGPIVRYQTIADEVRNRQITKENFVNGVSRFLLGLFKKVLLANALGELFTLVSAESEVSAATAWLGLIGFAPQIYFDFSGYSDMAIGLGLMMGFHFLENFDHPYISRSVTEFWRRWHMSLSTWFRDYVYIPLGGNRVLKGRHIFNLMVVWLLTGFWHGAAYNFILWGIYYGVLLILEKYVYGSALEKAPTLVKHIYTIFAFMIGWSLFAFDDMGAFGRFFVSLFGANGFADASTVFYLRSYIVSIIIGIFCSTPVIGNFLKKEHKPAVEIIISIVTAALFIVSIAALVTDSYNPFLYFRF